MPDPTNPTPYPLPDNKTRMTFRSNSYKSTGFNEMTFEDATGAENMFFHAQKDHTTKIENNQTLSVGADQTSVVGQNQSVTVGQNMTFEAGTSINFTIGGTGAGAAALMMPFTSTGMAAVTANLLGQGLSCAAEPSGEGGDLVQELSSVAGALAGGAMTLGPNLSGSLIGLLNQAGIQAQQNVWNGPSPRPDAGTALAAAGNLFGEAVGALFNLPGVHNHITGMMKADHVGCARIEQVGTTKVTNVGSTFGTKVGKTWSLVAGKDAFTTAGNDWGVASKRRSSIKAGENIMLQADHSISAIADDSIYIAAKDEVTISGKYVTISAQKQIVLQVGENASFILDKSGMIYSGSSSDIVLDAANKVWLHGGRAKVTVGPSENIANPPINPGNLGVMASLVKMLPLAGKNKLTKEITDRLGKQLDNTPEGKKINAIVDQFMKDLKDSLADPPAASP